MAPLRRRRADVADSRDEVIPASKVYEEARKTLRADRGAVGSCCCPEVKLYLDL